MPVRCPERCVVVVVEEGGVVVVPPFEPVSAVGNSFQLPLAGEKYKCLSR